MTAVILVHGYRGGPKENWFPWLRAELEKVGCKVFVPQFPTPRNQNLESWMSVFSDYEKYCGRDTILVGHSLGVAFVLKVLEKCRARAAFLVAGFTGLLGNPLLDHYINSIANTTFNWAAIKQNCSNFQVYCSDNDRSVPLKKCTTLASDLNVEPIILHNAGHINEAAGFVKFEKLFKHIKRELSS
jgi:uncharacterized protein